MVGSQHTEHHQGGEVQAGRSADRAAVGCLLLFSADFSQTAHKKSVHGLRGAFDWDFRGRCTISHKFIAAKEVIWKKH